MTKRSRNLLFLFAVVLFFLGTPLIILYSQGYYFDFDKKIFIKTGALFVTTKPPKAKIFVNDKFKKETGWLSGDLLIKNLKVRAYRVRVEKDGFTAWKKTLTVEPGLVSEAKNVLLLPLTPKKELASEEELKAAALTPTAPLMTTEQDALSAHISGNHIYYLDVKNGQLWRTSANQTGKEQITYSPLSSFEQAKDWPKNFSYQLIISPKQKIALIEQPDGVLYLFDQGGKSFQKLTDKIKSAQFSPDEQKLLYASENEIWVYFLDNVLGQPQKRAGERNLITRLSQKIGATFWLSDSEHVIFHSGNAIKITELDDRDPRNTVDVIVAQDAQFHYDPKKESVYFRENETVYRVSLKP